jgi:DNA-binding transcriptional LysR family regulator
MVEAGLGIAVLPSVSVERELATGSLVKVEIRDMEQPAQREVGVHVQRNRAISPALRDFLRLLTSEYGLANIFEARRPGQEAAAG